MTRIYRNENDRSVFNGSKIVDLLMDNPQGLCAAEICTLLSLNKHSFYKSLYPLRQKGIIIGDVTNRPVRFKFNPSGGNNELV